MGSYDVELIVKDGAGKLCGRYFKSNRREGPKPAATPATVMVDCGSGHVFDGGRVAWSSICETMAQT